MLSETRQQALCNSLNTVAKKVYGVVPIGEAWPLQHITKEMSRQGINMDLRVIHGSLGHMVSIGLVKESPHSFFTRTEVRERRRKPVKEVDVKADLESEVVPIPVQEEIPPTPNIVKETAMSIAMATANIMAHELKDSGGTIGLPKKESKKTPMEILAQIAYDLRGQAEDLMAEAEKIDQLAVEIEQLHVKDSAELERINKAKQALRTLLEN